MSTTPPPDYTSPQGFRDLNRRMAAEIQNAEPAPYLEGGYVRRVVEIRGRRSGQIHAVPIAVITSGGSRYLVSPTRERNWVRNLVADPMCVLRSRDTEEPCTATVVENPDQVAVVVSTYLAVMNAPWALKQFPFPRDAPRAQIAHHADTLAVFELTPTDS